MDGRSSDGGQLALTFSFRSLAALLILAVTVTSTDHVLDFSLSGSLSLSNIFYFKNSYCFWLNAFYGDNWDDISRIERNSAILSITIYMEIDGSNTIIIIILRIETINCITCQWMLALSGNRARLIGEIPQTVSILISWLSFGSSVLIGWICSWDVGLGFPQPNQATYKLKYK